MTTREDLLRRVAEAHDAWVDEELPKVGDLFSPSGRKKGSDYNLHYADLEADGAAEDAFAEAVGGAAVTASDRLRFDPHQKRDAFGRWSAFGGIPLSAQSLHVGDGRIDLEAHSDGVHLSLADRKGGTNVSGMLDPDEALNLADHLDTAIDEESDPGHEVTSSVHTFRGGGNAPATGYAHITWGAGEPIRLELRDTTEGVELTPQEARVLAEDLRRVGAARRVSTSSGPLDMFVPSAGDIGMRSEGDDGAVHELVMDAEDWATMWRGVDALWEGFDENGEFADPMDDIDRLTIDTPDGPVNLRRVGDADSRDSHIEIESPSGFKTRFRTDIDEPIWDAKEAAIQYAQGQGWLDE